MGGYYSISGYRHRRDCGNGCGYKETYNCNTGGGKVAFDSDDYHHASCSICSFVWPSSAGTDSKHNWAHQEGVHTCGDCGKAVSTGEHHYYTINGEAEESYSCKYTAHGNPCSYTISLAAAPFSGLPIQQYTCSDALVKMPAVPEFPTGVHDFSYTGTLYDSPTGGPYTDLKAPEDWFKLWGWWQRNVVHHASEGRTTALSKLKQIAPRTAAAIESHKATGNEGMDVDTYHYVNLIQDFPVIGWDTTYDNALRPLIHAGMGTFQPPEEFDGKTFKVDYSGLGSGGWFFWGSPFFSSDDLFKVGSYQKEGKIEIYADVYYIYITKDENGNWKKIPLNGYPDEIQLAESVVVYSHGRRTPTVSVTADVNLIDKTGYRYVRILYK